MRSIMFGDKMIGAILAAEKTETRRPCAVQPALRGSRFHVLYPWGGVGHGIYENEEDMRKEYDRLMLAHSPYKVGKVYVKETWRSWEERFFDENKRTITQTYAAYRATPRKGLRVNDRALITYLDQNTPLEKNSNLLGPWKSGRFLPQGYARLFLTIESVTIERLSELNEDAAYREGIGALSYGGACDIWFLESQDKPLASTRDPLIAFDHLWQSIYKEQAKNPLVYVVKFSVCK